VDDSGERTITTIGRSSIPAGHDEALPWHELARCDAVYFCAGDADALLRARAVRVLVATARELATIRQARSSSTPSSRAGRTKRRCTGTTTSTPHHGSW